MAAEPQLSVSNKILTLMSICIASITMPFNFTAAAVALPSIGHAFNGTPIAINWITNAFMLTFGSCLMVAGALADNYGRKRTFTLGIAAFALLSAVLTIAPNLFIFDLLRASQGVAAAIAFSGGMSALAQVFDGPARLKAFSFVGCSFGIGLAFGPVAAGVMIDLFNWSTVFLVITVLAGLSFILGSRVMRESRNPLAGGIDWPGAISFTWALGVFIYAILRVPESGWSDTTNLILFAISWVSFIVFVLIELNAREPMLDLTLFRFPKFVGVQLLAAAPAYSFVVLLLLLPLRFVGVEGMSVLDAGQLMIALSAPLLVLPIIAGLLTRWFSASLLCGSGLLICAAGLYWLSHVPTGGEVWHLALPMIVIGVGISLPWGLMDGLAVSVVPKERAGMATGIFSTTRVAGEGVAVAVVSALLSSFTANNLHHVMAKPEGDIVNAAQRMATGDMNGATQILNLKNQDALISSYNLAFSHLLIILTVITLIVAAVVFVFLDGKSTRQKSENIHCADEKSSAI